MILKSVIRGHDLIDKPLSDEELDMLHRLDGPASGDRFSVVSSVHTLAIRAVAEIQRSRSAYDNLQARGLREALDFWSPTDDLGRQVWDQLAVLCDYYEVRNQEVADAEACDRGES